MSELVSESSAAPRVLVAGIGNVFLGDDGFGVEVAQRLLARGGLPDGVEVADVGIRGVHLAYQLLDGWDGLLLVDAMHRDGPPGTLYRLEHTYDGPPRRAGIQVDGHDMSPDVVLGLLRELAVATDVDRPVGRVLVVGCEPATTAEGIGLSPPVAAAVEPALDVVDELLDLVLETKEGAHP
ncbi:hydrogenase maturation protease [Pseudonocardia endophytica]|uniref:Hydrogenase maturation protease n=1 Tax=Pseudonocardia endophytica TaxID=401976 RepID=A0A4R1HJ67_PSEEN|nr:hydrogenase maturation protease [Pseudonocardia endophytica]TCK22327.1 hydrogenase maturation protease [Pseudonocardia endophytica]